MDANTSNATSSEQPRAISEQAPTLSEQETVQETVEEPNNSEYSFLVGGKGNSGTNNNDIVFHEVYVSGKGLAPNLGSEPNLIKTPTTYITDEHGRPDQATTELISAVANKILFLKSGENKPIVNKGGKPRSRTTKRHKKYHRKTKKVKKSKKRFSMKYADGKN